MIFEGCLAKCRKGFGNLVLGTGTGVYGFGSNIPVPLVAISLFADFTELDDGKASYIAARANFFTDDPPPTQ